MKRLHVLPLPPAPRPVPVPPELPPAAPLPLPPPPPFAELPAPAPLPLPPAPGRGRLEKRDSMLDSYRSQSPSPPLERPRYDEADPVVVDVPVVEVGVVVEEPAPPTGEEVAVDEDGVAALVRPKVGVVVDPRPRPANPAPRPAPAPAFACPFGTAAPLPAPAPPVGPPVEGPPRPAPLSLEN